MVAIVGALGFLEETGRGGRVFGYDYPVLAGEPMDGVHDLIGIAYDHIGPIAIVLIIALIGAGAFWAVWLARRSGSGNLITYWFAALFLGLMVVAFLVDAVTNSYYGVLVDETLEMSAALVLALYVVGEGWPRRRRHAA